MHLVKMPRASENMVEGTVGRWLVAEGESIEANQPVVELITDKAEFELPCEVAGTLLRIVAAENSTVPVDYVLAVVGEPSELSPAQAIPDVEALNAQALARAHEALAKTLEATGAGFADPKSELEGPAVAAPPAAGALPPPARHGRVRATPAARRLAKQEEVDLVAVRERLQVQGAVNEAHVRRFLEKSRES